MGTTPATWGYRDIAACPQDVLDWFPLVISAYNEQQRRRQPSDE